MLEIQKIDVAYGDVQVIYGASLKIEQGEIVSLIGSNGAGKTTVIKTISGLLRPSSGQILFDGNRLDKLKPAHIVELGISQVPEGRKLFRSMTVAVNLEMGGVRKQAWENRQTNLQKVFALFPRLATRKKQLAGSLSGGEQQMLAIGRSLMSEPKLLAMDEPSLGLAPLVAKSILATILSIRKDGTTVLLVEQNLIQALKISDRGYVLETGRIVQTGRGTNLLQDDQIKRKYLGI